MIIITLSIGEEKYAIRADNVIEIVPIIKLKPLPMAESYIAGIINYRGKPIPVIDMCQLLDNRPCAHLLSTRLILIRIDGNEDNPLGLITEKATETQSRREDEVMDSNIKIENAPFLGGILHDDDGMIQLLDINKLLSKKIRDTLFQADNK
jgi:chemotaxis-related protein WspB